MAIVDADYARHLMDVAVAAATGVGPELRSAFRARPEVSFKRDRHDPVTEHDRVAEERIRDMILAGEPDSAVIGEETGTRGTGAVHWYVDPIDGTANFVHGLPFFCTSVAATVAGEVVAAAIYDPIREDLFTAAAGGAWRNGVRLRSSGASAETAAVLLTAYPAPRELAAHRDRALARVDTLVQTYASVRRLGSTVLALAYVAAGWADVAHGLSVSAWDLAAGSLVVTQAGGHFLALRTGPTDLPAWHGPGYLATTGSLAPAGSAVLGAFTDTHHPYPG